MRYFSYPVGQDIKKTDNIKCWQRESHYSHDCCWESGRGFWHLCWEIWQYQSTCPFIPKIQWILKKWARESTTLHQSWSLHRQTELPVMAAHSQNRSVGGTWATLGPGRLELTEGVQGTAPYTSRKNKPWCYELRIF